MHPKPCSQTLFRSSGKITSGVENAVGFDTDVGLKELAELKNLKSLALAGTKITDAGVKDLARLKNLKSLDLRTAKITDAVLKELPQMSSLRWLDVTDTRMTDAGVKELKKALPDCQIVD